MDKRNFAKLINQVLNNWNWCTCTLLVSSVQMSDIEDEVDSKAIRSGADEGSNLFGCFSDMMPKKMKKNVGDGAYTKPPRDDSTLPLRRGDKGDDEIHYQESVTNFHRNTNTDV